jgi:tRNA threonylcarbamoyladenosine modification (KEOPS) complex  Pcc1 subunit
LKAEASVRLRFGSERELDALVSALQPELERQIAVRSKTMLLREPCALVLQVEAEDTVALRAALNSYLRWINSMVNVLVAVEKSL